MHRYPADDGRNIKRFASHKSIPAPAVACFIVHKLLVGHFPHVFQRAHSTALPFPLRRFLLAGLFHRFLVLRFQLRYFIFHVAALMAVQQGFGKFTEYGDIFGLPQKLEQVVKLIRKNLLIFLSLTAARSRLYPTFGRATRLLVLLLLREGEQQLRDQHSLQKHRPLARCRGAARFPPRLVPLLFRSYRLFRRSKIK